ncbi:hypothetical protein [Clostridium sp. E02]|nr:hypothetical protein [Clostridium sp. E02]
MAVNALNTDLKNGHVIEEENDIILPSGIPTETALIFYPGAKVESEA